MSNAQHSVARQWNEVLLEGIRNDFARPTVHARNLFHASILMYDVFAAYECTSETYFLGNTIDGFFVPFAGVQTSGSIQAAQEEAMSYAVYRLMVHRFQTSPGYTATKASMDNLMNSLGYDINYTSVNYLGGNAAQFGNFAAAQMIAFGQQDGSNEQLSYANQYYQPVNQDLYVSLPGNPSLADPNRWQPLSVDFFIDQSGNPLPNSPPFLSPEWGNVTGFALDDSVKTTYSRNNNVYQVYHDPGPPPTLSSSQNGMDDIYKWNFALVAVWSSHLSASDTTMIDISPASVGNIPYYPTDFSNYDTLYNLIEGGDNSVGYGINPATNMPYAPQMVRRGDYARVLAEFWADGPDSETPPGHWYTILNVVNDHPALVKKWRGDGPVLSDLEWDVRTYFLLGGAMHDAAITAWSVKGWYDYIRPISAIRYMADRGQSTDTTLTNYHPEGLPLVPGYIETVVSGDALEGPAGQNIGKIKLYAWRGPDYIANPLVDEAEVGWILAENWWPYQRPSFVTPPFAGYVSGHSTYSRAGAEVMTYMTGDEYFPGGIGEFMAPANQFLVFEEGPSANIILQWAKYQDASDQCSLSRIWGGIHPPADDLLGRAMGEQVGLNACAFSEQFFDYTLPEIDTVYTSTTLLTEADTAALFTITAEFSGSIDLGIQPQLTFSNTNPTASLQLISESWTTSSSYNWTFDVIDADQVGIVGVEISGAVDSCALSTPNYSDAELFQLKMNALNVQNIIPTQPIVNDELVGDGTFTLEVVFGERMDVSQEPIISFPSGNPLNTLTLNTGSSQWLSDSVYLYNTDLVDINEEVSDIDVEVSGVKDQVGNELESFISNAVFAVDTKNPAITTLSANTYDITPDDFGNATFSLLIIFDEEMDQSVRPEVELLSAQSISGNLVFNLPSSSWLAGNVYVAKFDVLTSYGNYENIDVKISQAKDLAGNITVENTFTDYFSIHLGFPLSTETIETNQLKIYPNPVRINEQLIVESQNDINAVISIYDLNGRFIKSADLSTQKLAIDLTEFSQGFYLIRIESEQGEVKSFCFEVL